MHIFSPDVEALLSHLDQRGGGLRKKSDIGLIFEHAAEKANADLINRLIFSGKIIWSTYGVLRKTTEQTDGYGNLEREFMQAVNDVRIIIHEFTSEWKIEHKNRFEETYVIYIIPSIRKPPESSLVIVLDLFFVLVFKII